MSLDGAVLLYIENRKAMMTPEGETPRAGMKVERRVERDLWRQVEGGKGNGMVFVVMVVGEGRRVEGIVL